MLPAFKLKIFAVKGEVTAPTYKSRSIRVALPTIDANGLRISANTAAVALRLNAYCKPRYIAKQAVSETINARVIVFCGLCALPAITQIVLNALKLNITPTGIARNMPFIDVCMGASCWTVVEA